MDLHQTLFFIFAVLILVTAGLVAWCETVAPPPLDEFFMVDELPLLRHELAELGLPLE